MGQITQHHYAPTLRICAHVTDKNVRIQKLNFYMKTLIILACIIPLIGNATIYHVNKSAGNDAASGLESTPWESISHANTQAVAGDTVIVHAGIYNERVVFEQSGASGAYITFRAAANEEVIIDGSGIIVSGRQGLLEIQSKSYLRIDGFTLKNFTTSQPYQVPVGILIQGSGAGLEIVNNTIEFIGSTATVNASLLGRDAHGIGVFGTQNTAISDLLIRDNTIRNLSIGSSEALVLNGNVDGFKVLANLVEDCDNIGIDAIGFEGTAPTAAMDQARNGLIARNSVRNITTVSNPAYGGETSAGGIYVDGGRDIVIERNDVSNCDIGIEVASEHKNKVTSGITVRSNLIRNNLMGGLFIGGYNANSTGDADDCLIAHNTFYNNDTNASGDEYGQIYIQYRVTNTDFVSNIMYHDITKGGDYNLYIVQWNTTGGSMTFDRNLFYGSDTPVWIINDNWIEGFAACDTLSASGSNESWGNPLFNIPATSDFSLQSGSPAIDTGNINIITTGERDFLGHDRVSGAAPDAGAIERGSTYQAPGTVLIQSTGSALGLEWTIPNGALYQLQNSSDLATWRTVPGHDSESIGTTYSITTALSDQQFFRMRYD